MIGKPVQWIPACVLLCLVLAGPSFGQGAATAPAPNPYAWVDELKKPCDWFNWGADVRLRNEYLNNAFFLSDTRVLEKDKERDFGRFRVRLWGTVQTPDGALQLFTRLAWESRYYAQPETRSATTFPDSFYGGPILFDNLNVRLNKIGDLPVTVQVGRMDLMEKGKPLFGDGWLILDGTPLDGSRTIYFDAARLACEFTDIQTRLDVVGIHQASQDDRWLPTVDTHWEEDQIEQDETGLVVYVTNRTLAPTQIEGYFIYKHCENGGSSTPFFNGGGFFGSTVDRGDIYTFGGRIVHKFDDHWSARIEGAGQFGRKNSRDLLAFGANSRLTHACNDALKNQFKLNYEFLSGDDPATANRSEQFDPLWGRWPQWSELYIYTYAPETRIAEVTNLHRVGVGWQCDPWQDGQIMVDYHALFADTNMPKSFPAPMGAFITGDGYFRGHLVTAVLRHRFNRFLAGHLWGELFFPGDYYDRSHRDMATYFRAEVLLTF